MHTKLIKYVVVLINSINQLEKRDDRTSLIRIIYNAPRTYVRLLSKLSLIFDVVTVAKKPQKVLVPLFSYDRHFIELVFGHSVDRCFYIFLLLQSICIEGAL